MRAKEVLGRRRQRLLLAVLPVAIVGTAGKSPCSLEVTTGADTSVTFSLGPSTIDPWIQAEAFALEHGINRGDGCGSSICIAGRLVDALIQQNCDHESLRGSLDEGDEGVGLQSSGLAKVNLTALAAAAEASLRTVRRKVDATVCYSIRDDGEVCATDQTSPMSIAGRAYEGQLAALATAAADEYRWFAAEMHVNEMLELRKYHLEASAALTKTLTKLTSGLAVRFSDAHTEVERAPATVHASRSSGPAAPSCTNSEPLDDIGRRTGTDKSSRHHHFAEFYDMQLATLDIPVTSLLEIGVKDGRSLAMWAEKFPCAAVVGLDLEPDNAMRGDWMGYEVRVRVTSYLGMKLQQSHYRVPLLYRPNRTDSSLVRVTFIIIIIIVFPTTLHIGALHQSKQHVRARVRAPS